jgi:hypothetical protein
MWWTRGTSEDDCVAYCTLMRRGRTMCWWEHPHNPPSYCKADSHLEKIDWPVFSLFDFISGTSNFYTNAVKKLEQKRQKYLIITIFSHLWPSSAVTCNITMYDNKQVNKLQHILLRTPSSKGILLWSSWLSFFLQTRHFSLVIRVTMQNKDGH